jgi:hypothetical protein
MALLYVDEHSASLNRSQVTSGETLHEGEFVVDDGDNTVARFDETSDDLPHGIIVHHAGELSDALVEHDEDYEQNYDDLWKYDGDNDEYVYWQPLAAVDQIKPRSIDEQTTPSSSAPDFSEGDTVVVVNLGSGQTRVVPDSYSYDSSTYTESNNNAIAIGRVDKHKQEFRIGDTYDERIPVRLDADIFSTS